MFAARTGQASRPRRPNWHIRIALALATLLLVIGLVFSVHRLAQSWWAPTTIAPEPATAETTEPVAVNTLDPDDVTDAFRATVDTLSARIEKLEALGTTLTGRLAGIDARVDEVLADDGAQVAHLDAFAERLQVLESQQTDFRATVTALDDQIQHLAGQDVAAKLGTLNESVAQLRADNQQLLYRVNAIDALARTYGQQLTDLRLVLLQAPLPATAADVTVAPARLPFTVMAIDRWDNVPTVTVAEPPLAGKRRTVFLKQGESHLGWTLTRIDGRRVTFRHHSGSSLTATVAG